MPKQFDYLEFIKKILEFSPRQLEGEIKTSNFIKYFLKKNNIKYFKQIFTTEIPLVKKKSLTVDGVSIDCEASCFISGDISDKSVILSSLIPSAVCQNTANINFNPKCPSISCSNYYFAPAISVTHKGLLKILQGTKIKGEIKVDLVKHKIDNILVGNMNNPEYICFAHYDSIKMGAIDNASGVSLLMSVILNNPKTLKNTLFVFSANEELSYDKPIYWGHGFRVFEKKYYNLLAKAKKIIVVDSIGNSSPVILDDSKMIKLGFPINNAKKFIKKIIFIAGDFNHLMSVYHSDLDDGRGIKVKYLKETEKLLFEMIKNISLF